MSTTDTDRIILLVEDNPRDEELTLRALKKSNILNPIVVAHDGVEALDYLVRVGEFWRGLREKDRQIDRNMINGRRDLGGHIP